MAAGETTTVAAGDHAGERVARRTTMLARARTWSRRHPWVLDTAVALAVFAYTAPIIGLFAPERARLGAALVAAALCAPYLLRRRHPLPTFVVILLAATTQSLVGIEPLAADIMLAFALYNVASRFPWPVSVPALGAVILWIIAAFAPHLAEYHLSIGDLGLLVLTAVTAWTWGTTVRIRRDHVAGLEERALRMERERETQARIVAAEERARIAREIHDIVSHSLSAMVIMAEGASTKVRTEPKRAENAMERLRDTGRGALSEMRSMLGVLRDETPGSSTAAAGVAQLPALIEASVAAGVPTRLSTEGEPGAVSAGVDLTVYRVVQEALTNIRKHAGPVMSSAEVWLTYDTETLRVRVVDDGQGPGSATRAGSTPGHGIVGMRERVAAYGGTLRTGLRPGGGFEVTATLPIGGSG